MNRDWLWRGLAAALIAALVGWLASRTEWVEIDVKKPLRGEAADNDLYAAEKLLAGLGAKVTKPTGLDALPPAGATLMLSTWQWDLFPERAKRLQAWVESGGHLVIFASMVNHEQLKNWLPIERTHQRKGKAEAQANDKAQSKKSDEEEDDEDADEDSGDHTLDKAPPNPEPAASAALNHLLKKMPCRDTHEAQALPPSYADGPRRFSMCDWNLQSSDWTLRSQHTEWEIDSAEGPVVLRATLGRGSATVIQPWGLFGNEALLKDDNGLVAVAALQARAGAQIWFVTEESRPPFLLWLWQRAWAALLLAGVALALALWRGAVRFGPQMAALLPGRRSMAEQISGTAGFLRRQGPQALLAAQIRALETAAGSHLRGYAALDRTSRAAAIAQATGLDARALGLSLDKSLARRRVDLPATLELLETARRLLLQKARIPRK